MAVFESFSRYNAAHHFCPVMAIWSCSTWVNINFHIWAAARHFPAITKFYRIAHYQLALGGEVTLSITIKISTQATYLSLCSQTKGVSDFFYTRTIFNINTTQYQHKKKKKKKKELLSEISVIIT